MKVRISVNNNKERPPYIERIFRGSELITERPANVVAYYDVILPNTGQMCIFSVYMYENQIVQFEECDFVFDDNDYPLIKYLFDLEIIKDKADEIIKLVDKTITDLYFLKKDSALLEVDIKC